MGIIRYKMKKHKYGKFTHMSEHNLLAIANKYDKHALIYKGAEIGDNTFIGPFTFIDSKVKIGKECSISLGAMVLSHDTSYYHVSEGKTPKEEKETIIEDYCAIGANAVILPGVLICYHSIVGAGAVVTHNVEPYSIVAGNPAIKIGKVKIANG